MKKLLLICWFIGLPVMASPVATLSVVGQSELNWMFWKVYDITLLSGSGRYQDSGYPIALAIEYARDIEAEMLVETTVKEWQRIDVDWKPQWREQLQDIWPSVTPGDELLLHVNDQGISQFFFNDDLIGEIQDAEFAPAFLAIWLSDKTRKPKLRMQLLGEYDA
ncbi:MAG: chalcone isomerase family protein [Gammaproteobacteria bacterium]|nr:chalcone isomerase family protein [Gammaproteobacteria bacterium]